jgi:hypothetical protein
MHANAKSKVFYMQLDGSTCVLQPCPTKHTPHWRNPHERRLPIPARDSLFDCAADGSWRAAEEAKKTNSE